MIDPSINLGNLLTIASIAAVALGFVWALKGDTRVLAQRLTDQDKQLTGMNLEIKKLSEVLITLATQDIRVRMIEERQMASGKRLDEISRRVNEWVDSNARTQMRGAAP